MRVFKYRDTYVADLRINGKTKRFYTKLENRAAAQKAAEAELKRLKEETAKQDRFGSSLALKDLDLVYMNAVGNRHRGKANTITRLEMVLKFFAEVQNDPNKLLTEVTHDDAVLLREWRAGHLVGKTTKRLVSNSTVNSTVEQLKKLFTFCKDRGIHFPKEPKWRKIWLHERKEHQRELSADERERLYAAIARRPDYVPLVAFSHATGKRKMNVLELSWPQVKWELGVIEFRGKGDIPITQKITPAIRDLLWPLQGHHPVRVFTYVCQQTCERRMGPKDEGAVVKLIKGERYPITAAGLRQFWEAVRVEAKLTKDAFANFRFHDLRHDFATKLLRKVKNPRFVQKSLDHADDSKTWMRYAHVLEGEVADAIEQLAQEQKAAREEPLSKALSHTASGSTKLFYSGEK